MAYTRDLQNSARRHLAAADLLASAIPPTGRPDVGGYLYGVAAECALKQIMLNSGMRELPPSERSNDPFYKHFPILKTLLRETASGRRAGELRRYSENQQLMQGWDTQMRYAPSRDIQIRQINLWKEQAKNLVQNMNVG
jgi:hypothetical protein